MLDKHSITISGHSTSITLEPQFWSQLKVMAKTQGKSLNCLVTEIDKAREDHTNLSSAIRLFILQALLKDQKAD